MQSFSSLNLIFCRNYSRFSFYLVNLRMCLIEIFFVNLRKIGNEQNSETVHHLGQKWWDRTLLNFLERIRTSPKTNFSYYPGMKGTNGDDKSFQKYSSEAPLFLFLSFFIHQTGIGYMQRGLRTLLLRIILFHLKIQYSLSFDTSTGVARTSSFVLLGTSLR